MTGRSWRAAAPLSDRPWLQPLVRDALLGTDRFPGAAAEAKAFLDSEPREAAPAWDSPWFEGWSAAQTALQATDEGRRKAIDHLAALRDGRADVVITGQQPGFLGGPFYTLLKVAGCIAAAEARTAAGRLTVPLFWSGDADDDLAEAVDVRIWDPRRGAFLKPVKPVDADGVMVGALRSSVLGRAEAAWLRTVGGAAAAAMTTLWDAAVAADGAWGALHVAALRRLFPNSGLLTVSGNDPGLIETAAPLLRRAVDEGDDVTRIVRASGAALAEGGYHAQIGEASLERPLHRAVGDRRRRLASVAEAAGVPVRELRPGVLWRSPLQDWLFRPAGVVVGPGERAYLEQLRPMYEALGLVRSPLLPRAHARLGREVERTRSEAADVAPHVDDVIEAASDQLTRSLEALGSADASERAGRIAGRWRGALTKALTAVAAGGVAERNGAPDDWRNPRGSRQERTLPGLWAAALWPDLPEILADVAADHLARTAAGDPREYEIDVDETVLEESP